jgi:prepilin-type processing-associated H-X9-DG protein
VGPFVRITDITDGTSNTLLVGEWTPTPSDSSLATPTAWQPFWDSYGYASSVCQDIGTYNFGPPTPPFWSSGFGSFHPGGANFAFADGSVRFLSYGLLKQLPDGSKTIIEALATRNGGEVVDGSNY